MHLNISDKQICSIRDMLSALANVCDSAESQDNQGFSRADLIGHYIADLPLSHFNDEWIVTSLLIIKKYSRQLKKMEMNSDVAEAIRLLQNIDPEFVRRCRSERRQRQSRCIIVNKGGDFEIYFPTKKSLEHFPTKLVQLFDWINEVNIPHGYLFVVKRGARQFVECQRKEFDGWLITEEAEGALIDESVDSINVSRAIIPDLFILGSTLSEPINIIWANGYKYLLKVLKFSRRRYRHKARAWEVSIATPEDWLLLKELSEIKSAVVYVDRRLASELNDLNANTDFDFANCVLAVPD